MVHGTFILKPYKYWSLMCTSTVPNTTLNALLWYSRGTLLSSAIKGIEANVPCTTFLKTMELFKYCLKNNIGLKLPDMAEPGQTNEVTFPEKKEVWNIAPLEEYFNTCCIPIGSVKLDRCTTVFNPLLFVGTHLAIIKAHNGNPVYRPYFDRLVTFREILESINLNYIKQ